ncbi:MAG: hypothetical protein AAGD96_36295, partial [Chloroflexota bacterium]
PNLDELNDTSSWDELESAFEPLKEFDDEDDVFSGVRDTPKIYETISAESLAAFQGLQNGDGNASSDSDGGDDNMDFLSALSNTDDAEMPSWANELRTDSAQKETEDNVISDEVSPLQGIEDIVEVAPSIAKPVSDLKTLHAPQMMEPVAHRRRANLAAQAAGTVPMSDPTQPVVVPKERQRYQPRFDANTFDGRPVHEKSKRSRQVGFLVLAGILALILAIGFAIPWLLNLVTG